MSERVWLIDWLRKRARLSEQIGMTDDAAAFHHAAAQLEADQEAIEGLRGTLLEIRDIVHANNRGAKALAGQIRIEVRGKCDAALERAGDE